MSQESRRVVSSQDISEITNALMKKIGLNNDSQRLAINNDGNTNEFDIDWDEILQLVDSVGGETYTFNIGDTDNDPYTFYNLVIKFTPNGDPYKPFLMKYELAADFIPDYMATGSLENFRGKATKIPVSAGASSSGNAQANLEIPTVKMVANDPNCPSEVIDFNNDTDGSGGSGGIGIGGTTGGGTTTITTVYTCDFYIVTNYYDSYVDGVYSGTNSYNTLEVDCYTTVTTSHTEAANSENCETGPGDIPIIEPELAAALWETGICETDAFQNNSCLSRVWSKLKQSDKAYKLVEKFTGDQPKPIDLCLDSKISLGPGKESTGGHTYRDNGTVKIDFNATLLSQYSELVSALTMIHEIIHAEMFRKIISKGGTISIDDFPGIYDYYSRYMPLKDKNGNTHYPNANPQHNLMADHYLAIITEALMEYDGASSGDYDKYEALAWQGLKGTTSWNSKTEEEKNEITALTNALLSNRPNCI